MKRKKGKKKKLFTKRHVPPESKSIIPIFTERREKYIIATTNPPIIPLSMLKLESSLFCEFNFDVRLKRKKKN